MTIVWRVSAGVESQSVRKITLEIPVLAEKLGQILSKLPYNTKILCHFIPWNLKKK